MPLIHQEGVGAAKRAQNVAQDPVQDQQNSLKGMSFAAGQQQLAPGANPMALVANLLGQQQQQQQGAQEQAKPEATKADAKAAPQQVPPPQTIPLGDDLAMTVFHREGNNPPTIVFTSKTEKEGGEMARNARANMAEHLGTIADWLKKVSNNGQDKVILQGRGISGAALAQMAGVLYNPYVLACEISHAPKADEKNEEQQEQKAEDSDKQQGGEQAAAGAGAVATAAQAQPGKPAEQQGQQPQAQGQQAHTPQPQAQGQQQKPGEAQQQKPGQPGAEAEQAPAQPTKAAEQKTTEAQPAGQEQKKEQPGQEAQQPQQAEQPQQEAGKDNQPVGADGQVVTREVDQKTDGVKVVNVPELDKRPKAPEEEVQQVQQVEEAPEAEVETQVTPDKEPVAEKTPEPSKQQRISAWLQAMMQKASGWLQGAFNKAFGRVNAAVQGTIARIRAHGHQLIARTHALMHQLQHRMHAVWQRVWHQRHHWLGLGLSRANLWMRRLHKRHWHMMRARYGLMQRRTTLRLRQMQARMGKQLRKARSYVKAVQRRMSRAIATARRRAQQVRHSLRVRLMRGRRWLHSVAVRVRRGGIRSWGQAQRIMGWLRQRIHTSWAQIAHIAVRGVHRIGTVATHLAGGAQSVWAHMRAAITRGWGFLLTGGNWMLGILRAGWGWFAAMGSQWWKLSKTALRRHMHKRPKHLHVGRHHRHHHAR